MGRFLTSIHSAFRPPDESLSSEEKSRIQVYRLLSLLGAALTLFVGSIYASSRPSGVDPAWARRTIALLFAVLFAASYISGFVRRHYVEWMWALLCVFMGWFTAIATLNSFAGNYDMGLLLAYAALTAVVGLGAKRIEPVLWFLGYGFLLAALGALVGPVSEAKTMSMLASMGSVFIVEGIAIHGRLSAQRKLETQKGRLREHRQNVQSLYTASTRLLQDESREAVAEDIQQLLQEVFDYPICGTVYADGGHLVPAGACIRDGYRSSLPDIFEAQDDTAVGRAYRSGETVHITDLQTLRNEVNYDDLQSAAAVPIEEHGAVFVASTEEGGIDSFDLRLIEILSAHAAGVLDGLDRLVALRESEERFRGMCRNAAIGVALLDKEGRLLEANPALQEMLGYDPGGLEGIHFAELTHPDDRNVDRQQYEELVAGKRERYQMEKRYLRKGGEEFWGRLTASRHEEAGELRVIGMVEDIDDRKHKEKALRAAKEEAEQAARLKSAFLANMSHEIRTPLTSIIGFAETIGEEIEALEGCSAGPDLAALRRFSSLIERGGHRLLETLNAVLNLSKLEAGEMELSPEPVDLVEEAEEAASIFQPRADEAGLTLQVDTPEEPVWGRADEGGLQIALRNLLSNAIKYTDEGGQVQVRARKNRDEAVIEVEDTGIGMEPEKMDELFSAFKQESEGMGREYEGSGLGLTVTKKAVDQMNGAIEVETEKGEGTCVAVSLPQPESAQNGQSEESA